LNDKSTAIFFVVSFSLFLFSSFPFFLASIIPQLQHQFGNWVWLQSKSTITKNMYSSTQSNKRILTNCIRNSVSLDAIKNSPAQKQNHFLVWNPKLSLMCSQLPIMGNYPRPKSHYHNPHLQYAV
jgi:hypothetical protein